MARKPLDIAIHIIYHCPLLTDKCECSEWPEEDRVALAAMSIEEADAIVTSDDSVQDEDAACGKDIDYENHVDGGRYDLSDDAEALASAGWGTDEDYFFGDTY